MTRKTSTTRLLRERLALVRDDSGLSIIEVLVAFLVFTIIAVGVAQAMVTSARLNGDQAHRSVALNLAAGEVDRLRASSNIYGILSDATGRTRDVDGITYTITRDVEWVSQSGADLNCGVGNKDFQLKRVNIAVDWRGRLTGTKPVSSDTLLSPTSQITNPTAGTILIKVTKRDGTPYQGVPVTLTATAAGASATAPATDAEGCSYALDVTAGTYDVKIQVADNLDPDRAAAPIKSVVVGVGKTVDAEFSYDKQAIIKPTYATGANPTNLNVTYYNSNSIIVESGTPSQVKLYPWGEYNIVAGTVVAPNEASDGCVSPDPASWPASTILGLGLQAGVRQPATGATPGSTITAAVLPMGQVQVTVPNNSNRRWLTAVNAAAPLSADPGCAEPQSYTFPRYTPNQTVLLNLPYGSWTIYAGDNSGALTQIVASKPMTNATGVPLLASNVVTLDPRMP